LGLSLNVSNDVTWPQLGERLTNQTTDFEISLKFEPNQTLNKSWNSNFDLDLQENKWSIHSDIVDCLFDFSKKQGKGTVRAPNPYVRDALENLLRYLSQAIALHQGQIILHGSGILDRQRKQSYLFLGPSTAGKTTIARIAAQNGFAVLSDDLVLVRSNGSKLFATAIPFHGDFPGQVTLGEWHEVSGLYLLNKAGITASKLIENKAEKTSKALGNVPFIEGIDTSALGNIIRMLQTMLNHTSVYDLFFTPNAQFLEHILQFQTGTHNVLH